MSDPLDDYIHSLNPKPEDQVDLIYGAKYKIWRDGKFTGIATWTKDENVGDSFQAIVGKDRVQVFTADKWELVIDK